MILMHLFYFKSALSNTLPAKIQTYLSFGKPIIVSSDGEAKNFVKK